MRGMFSGSFLLAYHFRYACHFSTNVSPLHVWRKASLTQSGFICAGKGVANTV